MRNFLESPFNDEAQTRSNQSGRSEFTEQSRLRGDFAAALARTLHEDEGVRTLVAIRPDRVGGAESRASVLALTDRALIRLRQPAEGEGSGYGVRALVVPYRAMTSVELGERLLRGMLTISLRGHSSHRNRRAVPAFSVLCEGGGSIEIVYHALDDELFNEVLRNIRVLAGL